MTRLFDTLATAFPAAALVVGIVYLFRDVIVRFVTKSVDAKFDMKLEALRSELRKSEQTFAADLRNKEAQINSLRQGALSGLASRQVVLDRRRIEAVEKIWSSVLAYRKFLMLVQIMSVLKFEDVARRTEMSNDERRKFEQFLAPFQLETFSNIEEGSQERPFLTPLAWSLYDSYKSVFSYAYTKATVIKLGVGVDVLKKMNLVATLGAVLPNRKEYIEMYGETGIPHLVGEIETRLLNELMAMLTGSQSDQDSIKQAHAIMQHADAIASVDTRPLPEGLRREELAPAPTD